MHVVARCEADEVPARRSCLEELGENERVERDYERGDDSAESDINSTVAAIAVAPASFATTAWTAYQGSAIGCGWTLEGL